jgi:hypothetical protein
MVEGKEFLAMDSRDIETYCENGTWKNRRGDCDQPFSSGPRLRQIAIGAEVARWARASHIIRGADGTIEEINIYGSGPYPPRSPIKTIRNPTESLEARHPDHTPTPTPQDDSRHLLG